MRFVEDLTQTEIATRRHLADAGLAAAAPLARSAARAHEHQELDGLEDPLAAAADARDLETSVGGEADERSEELMADSPNVCLTLSNQPENVCSSARR